MDFGNRDNGDRGTMSQINVTPLVDVMLVLLVIFMVTAPMMQQGVQVNLPKAETKSLAPKEDTLVVSIEKSGRTFINTNEISADQLKDKLNSMLYLPAKLRCTMLRNSVEKLSISEMSTLILCWK